MAATTYREAGVDLNAAAGAKQRLAKLVSSTSSDLSIGGTGGFGGMMRLPPGLGDAVLVASADGVGTKLKVAFATGRHGTVGRCLVNHCVNDVLVQGARPLFFMDYLAVGSLDEGTVTEIVGGVAAACSENGLSLLGGETAEMPDFYAPGEYDLAGFVVGVVEEDRVIDGSATNNGDVLVSLDSSGLHTNGYSLVRRIVFGEMGLSPRDELPGTGRSVSDELLEVHRSYAPVVLAALDGGVSIHALAHITGGGVSGNLPRVLPEGFGARIELGSWPVPPVFRVLAEAGGVDDAEMERVFNMGIGMIVVLAPEGVETIRRLAEKAGIGAHVIGEVGTGEGVEYI